MSEHVWTAEQVAEVGAEALRLAGELRPVWPDEPSGGVTTSHCDGCGTPSVTRETCPWCAR